MPGYRGTKKESRSLSAYVKLMRAAESITARVHRHLRDLGLTVSQFAVLEALYHLGPMSQVEIGRKILKTGGNITMVIDNLEKRELLSRERSREDRRYFKVHLTDAGTKLIAELFPGHAGIISREMEILSADEQETLARLCKKLGLAGA